MGSVKVGQKGQIVIPKEARELFGIQPGDTLLLLADVDRGIAIQQFEAYQTFFQQMFEGKKGAQEPLDGPAQQESETGKPNG